MMSNNLKFLCSALALGMCIPFVSCYNDDNKVYDIYPLEFRFEVVDADGNNLMDTVNNVSCKEFVKNTYILFQDKTYHIGDLKEGVDVKPSTRYFYSPFYGIQIEFNEANPYACIGPLLADRKWMNEKLLIHWGDGTEDTLVFTSYLLREYGDNLLFYQKGYLNGKEATEIVKGHRYLMVKNNK